MPRHAVLRLALRPCFAYAATGLALKFAHKDSKKIKGVIFKFGA
jgi:hypothetical protein